MLPSFPDPIKRNLAKLICLILFLTLALFASPDIASAAPACNVPSSGNWIVNSDCKLVRNEKAPKNVVVRNSSTLIVPNHRSLNINFADFSLRVADDSRVLVAPNGKIGICIVNFDRPRNQKVDADPHVDGNRFIEVLRENLPLSRHMGYVVSLQNSNLRNVAWDASGYAISNCDSERAQPFTIDTATTWGSVSKLITAAVVARLAQDSNRVDLGDRFGPFIPDRWVLNNKFKDVNFAQLLGHRAGLRKSSKVPLRKRLAENFDDDPRVGPFSYSNTGAGIAGRMIMRAIFPDQARAWEQQHAQDSDDVYDDEFNKWASSLYLEFVDRHLLTPSNIDFNRDASCRLSQFKDNGLPYAHTYRSGNAPDGILFRKDDTFSCFSGGWVMSARHMARLMRTLRHSDAIVNRNTYSDMTACGIGFDGTVRFDGGVGYSKNGRVPVGNGGYIAYVMALPGGYTVVAASNSGETKELRDALISAFNASYSPPGPVRVPSSSCPYW